jgi:DNA-binding NtrC family response regulator
MDLTLGKIRDLFDKGQYSKISQAAGSDIAHLKTLQPELRALVAHALVYTARSEIATELSLSLRHSSTPLPVIAESHIVVGLIRKREGLIEEASIEFRTAARCAQESRDKYQLAWAQAHLFRLLAAVGHPESHITALLADARKCVSNSGDPQVMAYLHDSVATMEAQKGHLVEAERHLRLARSLIDLRPNVWLEQLLALNASCIAIIDCDADGFGRHSADARTFARLTGNASVSAAIEVNEAHAAIVAGQFVRASLLLERILRAPHSIYIELGARESVARMHLAKGDLVACEEALTKLDALRKRDLTKSFTFRGVGTLRVKLLIRQGRFEDAAQLAHSLLDEFARVNDSSSIVALTTLRAVALNQLGKTDACAHALLAASYLGATTLREHQGEYAHACGLVWRHSEPTKRSPFEARSFRIWGQLGNRCASLEAITSKGFVAGNEDAARQLLKEHAPIESKVSVEAPGNPLHALDHLASAFDLAYSPELLGQELQRAIDLCGLSPETELVNRPVTADAASRSIALGDSGPKPLSLLCQVPEDPLKAILLGDILRIGRAALALERAREEERSRAALWPADPVEDQGDAIFLSEEMQALLAIARRIATTTVPVLITGETGTGKEVLARTIHALSTRASAIFLPFNCTSTPKDMLDSQLFGHRRGAFTGAAEHFQGVIRAASGGTLFLDEIGDTGLDVQPKLLRFLEASEVHPIGETQPARVDVRVIVATNANLETLVRDGRFREDLFYRLSIVRLHLPPLRERRVEIPTLVHHYLRKHANEYRKGDLRLSEDTMEYLMLYRWPGNVRQLANEMRRLAALAETSAVLMPEHLSPEITASRRTVPASERGLEPTEVVVRLDQPMAAAVRHLEQTMLQYALKKCDGRIEDTAAMLGLSRKGLYLKRQRFGIDPPGTAAIA